MEITWGSFFFAFVSIILTTRGAAQETNCNAALTRLAPCLRFLQNRAESPSSRCCERFATIVESSPRCLCGVANGDPLPLGITVNHTRSLALPQTCNVTAPSPSACNETSTASEAPAPSPFATISEDTTPPSPAPSPAEVNAKPPPPTSTTTKLPRSPPPEKPSSISRSSKISGLVSSAACASAALGFFFL